MNRLLRTNVYRLLIWGYLTSLFPRYHIEISQISCLLVIHQNCNFSKVRICGYKKCPPSHFAFFSSRWPSWPRKSPDQGFRRILICGDAFYYFG